MFFEKIIAACSDDGFRLESALFKQLQNGGIKADFSDLSADRKGIYFYYPSNRCQKVLLYQAKIQEATFRNQGDPYVHLCGCKACLEGLKNSDFLAVVAYDLRFFLGIYSHKVQVKFFHDKPLALCPECLNIAEFNGDLKTFLT
ncbi:hypothetical protein [Helicobacter turcicus]|uniref:Uncharacterized protein n=1 Tax=Helicobacter turcicus TaxID=2867412 RepID=A0ABS7JNR2_9HELI|nr:hypothetical protein [Helicobacter turcicus]MBX7490999.1 hypothetical protein [Helicobacter turcicus]MBX7545874.1 hypothetical protein [Helicobacter turcicus]